MSRGRFVEFHTKFDSVPLFNVFLHRKRKEVRKHDHTQTAVTHDWLNQYSWNKYGHAAKVTTNVTDIHQRGATLPIRTYENQYTYFWDKPHLLKCTCNLFLKNDVQFESEHLDSQVPVVAKREHIEKLYKHDRDSMICMLYKLSDTHLAPVTQCAMKVSFAVQVKSHTVAAGIYTLVSYGKERCLHSVFVRNKVTYTNVTWYLF